eukprot:Gb_29447 [translate_table: standard]
MVSAREELSLLLFCVVFSMYLVSASAQSDGSIHFSYPFFDQNSANITYMGNASVSHSKGINITPDPNATHISPNQTALSLQNCIGRVLYHRPITIWPASFTTTFTILVQNVSSSGGQKNFNGDGLAFIIVPNNRSFLPESYGAFLGLFDQSTDGNATGQIAIEFDTFKNEFDPNNNHVGVDVQSIKSATTANLGEHGMDIKSGNPITVRVEYNGWTKSLQIYAAYANTSGPLQGLLNYTVELKNTVPKSAYIGFSAATGNSYESHRVLNWNFSSSILPESSLGSTAPAPSPTGGSSGSGLKVGLVLGLIAVGVVLVGLLWFVARTIKKRRNYALGNIGRRFSAELATMDTRSMDYPAYGPHRFPYKQLAAATNNFSEAELLGTGGFGSVYRGTLGDTLVAVKRISATSRQGEREFVSEISTIGRLRHRNLVQLQGWCHEKDELLLVYEYMPNGSLDKILFRPSQDPLDWQRRYKVLCGLAAALLYLHEEWEQRVVHRDIKPSNVMLDGEFNARLGDFGLARLIEHDESNPAVTTMLAGTPGYVAPECGYTGKPTAESDVFSFGIVMLEVASGRRVVERKPPLAEGNLVDWIWNLYGNGSVIEAADSRLEGEFDEEQMKRVLVLGLACSHPDPQLRPSIRQALQVLINPNEQIMPLPSSRPVAIYVVLPPGSTNLPSTSSISNAAPSSSAFSGVTSITASTLHYGR